MRTARHEEFDGVPKDDNQRMSSRPKTFFYIYIYAYLLYSVMKILEYVGLAYLRVRTRAVT